MHKQKDINKLIEDALNSADDIKHAAVKPFLLTRIHARMSKETRSVWEKAGRFISRPAVAFTGLCLVLLINTMAVLFVKSSSSNDAPDRTVQTQVDEFSYAVATIYEIENTPANDK